MNVIGPVLVLSKNDKFNSIHKSPNVGLPAVRAFIYVIEKCSLILQLLYIEKNFIYIF